MVMGAKCCERALKEGSRMGCDGDDGKWENE